MFFPFIAIFCAFFLLKDYYARDGSTVLLGDWPSAGVRGDERGESGDKRAARAVKGELRGGRRESGCGNGKGEKKGLTQWASPFHSPDDDAPRNDSGLLGADEVTIGPRRTVTGRLAHYIGKVVKN